MGRAAWCEIAYRLETALDDPAETSRLAWSKTHADPATMVHAGEILAATVGAASDVPIDPADPTAWERATQVGVKAVGKAARDHGTDVAAGFGL